MKTYEEIIKELDAPIPRDVIETRDGGRGMKLSYLSGHYVIDRLNKVIGQGNWAYDSTIELIHAGTLKDRYDNDVHSVHYSARVILDVLIGDRSSRIVDYGYGDGTDKTNPGKAHELALKEAITDGLKRCAKSLGMSMGLALYSKGQENVIDADEDKASERKAESSAKPEKPTAKEAAAGNDDKVKELIRSTIRVGVKTGKVTQAEMKEYLQNTHKAPTLDDLGAESLKAVLEHVQAKLGG